MHLNEQHRIWAKKVVGMTCKTCNELDKAVAAMRQPDAPHVLEGLSEAGLRNHARQREEKMLKAEINLEKHQRACTNREDRAAF